MFGIDDATAVAVMPTPEAAGTPGYFTEGNPALGQAATYVRASFLNALQTEILNILTGAGISPSKTVYDQLLTGLRSNALITGNATGAANTYAVAYTPAITALVDGMVLWFKASATNTGASTLNINAVGAKAIVGGAHAALQGGEILANGRCLVVWNATLNSFVLIECTGASLQVSNATASQHAIAMGQLYGGAKGIARYTVSGSWTSPINGTIYVSASAAGSGGGGGGGATNVLGVGAGGAGGSAGQSIIRQAFTVTLGQVIPITIGTGGVGGGAGTPTAPGGQGTAGGNTVIGSLITLTGGSLVGGGFNFSSGVPAGGAPGAGYPSGTGGADGASGFNGGVGIGGMGASGPFGGGGGGGRSGSTGVSGSPAAGYGSGGGGAGGSYGSSGGGSNGGSGGTGAGGIAIIEW